MKKLSLIVVMFFIGCGSGENTITVDNNVSIPFDENKTIISTSNVSTITYGDGSIQVTCQDNSTCDITLGDKTTDNSVITTNVDGNESNETVA